MARDSIPQRMQNLFPTLTPFLFSILPIISSTLPLSFHPSFLLVSSYFPLIKKYHEKHALQIRLFISNTYQKSTYHVSKSKKKGRKERKTINLSHRSIPKKPTPSIALRIHQWNPSRGSVKSRAFCPPRNSGRKRRRGDSKSIGGITRRDQSMVEPLSPPPPLSRREETRPHNGGVGRERGGG